MDEEGFILKMIKELENSEVKSIQSAEDSENAKKVKIYSIIHQVNSMYLNSRPSKAVTPSFLQVIVEKCGMHFPSSRVYVINVHKNEKGFSKEASVTKAYAVIN